jgi:predicted DNA-binding transcriptional regulator AlpA
VNEPKISKFEHAAMLLGMHPTELHAALRSAASSRRQPADNKPRRGDALPRSLPPIGLAREIAAAYIDVSPTKFDQMVADGRMPKPKRIDARRVWERSKIEKAFAALPSDGENEPEAIDWDAGAISRDEQTRTELNQWEQVLLIDLCKRGKPAHYSTIKGTGPVTRRRLAERGLIMDKGGVLAITDEGERLAKQRSAGRL